MSTLEDDIKAIKHTIHILIGRCNHAANDPRVMTFEQCADSLADIYIAVDALAKRAQRERKES